MRCPAHSMASSDFSSTYILGVRLVAFPSRPGTRVREWMRPPRFRAKNVSTCTRSPTARGSFHASQYVMGRCCLLFLRIRSAPRNWTRFAAQYLAHGLPCERFTAALASRTSCITRGRGGSLDLPRGGLSPPILCQHPGALRVGSGTEKVINRLASASIVRCKQRRRAHVEIQERLTNHFVIGWHHYDVLSCGTYVAHTTLQPGAGIDRGRAARSKH